MKNISPIQTENRPVLHPDQAGFLFDTFRTGTVTQTGACLEAAPSITCDIHDVFRIPDGKRSHMCRHSNHHRDHNRNIHIRHEYAALFLCILPRYRPDSWYQLSTACGVRDVHEPKPAWPEELQAEQRP